MIVIFHFSSITQSCPTVCYPMDSSSAGLPMHHQRLEKFKVMSIELLMPSNHLTLCHPLLLLPSIFPSIRVFSNESFLPSGGQSTGASASASVLPMSIQGWFPLGLTSLISLESKGFSRAFFNTTVQKHQFFGTQLSLEKSTTTDSSVLAWRIPWTEEPGGLQSMGSQRLGHYWRDLASAHTHSFLYGPTHIHTWLLEKP